MIYIETHETPKRLKMVQTTTSDGTIVCAKPEKRDLYMRKRDLYIRKRDLYKDKWTPRETGNGTDRYGRWHRRVCEF